MYKVFINEKLIILSNTINKNEISDTFLLKDVDFEWLIGKMTSGKMYESAVGIYDLIRINGKWFIIEMSIYDDNEKALSSIDLSKMWFPEKENSA